MQPVSPVFPNLDLPEVTCAKDQPEYSPLPAHRQLDGMITTRWRCSWRDRLRVLIYGDVYLSVMTFNQPLQPVKVYTERKAVIQ